MNMDGIESRIKSGHKNIYIALILTFFITGLGSVYAGKIDKGLRLLAFRILFICLGVFIHSLFIISALIGAYAFYEAYKDVQKANGNSNPKLIDDYKSWNQNTQNKAKLMAVIIAIFTLIGCFGFPIIGIDFSSDSNTNYHTSDSSSSIGPHSHYGGVDTSPSAIARTSPDWYYDYYDYGDYDEIDEFLESEGYD